MANPSQIRQFLPDGNRRDVLGALGWGVDIGNFRVVMYAPVEYNPPHLRASQDAEDGEKNFHKKRAKIIPQGADHGPAHVHVIDKSRGKESRFELIQGVLPEDSYVLPMKAVHDHRVSPLTEVQKKIVPERLNEWVPAFVQLWQELYHNKQLKQCVSRVSEKHPYTGHIERVIYTQPTAKVSLVDMANSTSQKVNFQSYVEQPPAQLER